MTASTSSTWFDVDREGLALQLARRPKGFVLLELLQNAIDESSSRVVITLDSHSRRGCSWLVVADDNPSGFADLADAYTLFKHSKKAADVTKRGRFNSGEKMVLALCVSASVTSTSGAVIFEENGTRHRTTKRLPAGSEFAAVIRMTADERREAALLLRTCLVPPGVEVVFNGEVITPRPPVRSFTVPLATEIDFRPTTRRVAVSVYEVADGEKPHLYELGIPVVRHDGRWHIDIAQKVPLNADRDNVTPAFLRDVRVAVLDHCHDLLTSVDAKSVWVKDALPRASDDAVRKVVVEKFGPNAVIADASNPEATKTAVDQGRTIVYGRSFSVPEWEAIRRADALKPAGQVIEVGIPVSPDGVPPVPWDDWTPAMERVADYAVVVGRHLLSGDVDVEFTSIFGGKAGASAAWFGRNGSCPRLTFNLGRLGKHWPGSVSALDLDALLIHEFAHAKVTDHLSHAFHDECCRLGALLRSCPVIWTQS